MAEYGSSGIWVVKQVGVFRHGMIEHYSLGLPKELSDKFKAWIEQYEIGLLNRDDFDSKKFIQAGRSLASDLKQYVGNEIQVYYAPEDNIHAEEIIE